MENKDQNKSHELQQRMLEFAIAVIKQLQSSKTLLPYSVVDQLTKSSAAIGANYAEARNAASRPDFKNKIFVSKKEAAETRYWIDLCIGLSGQEEVWQPHRKEAQELLMILQTTINSLRTPPAK